MKLALKKDVKKSARFCINAYTKEKKGQSNTSQLMRQIRDFIQQRLTCSSVEPFVYASGISELCGSILYIKHDNIQNQ